MNAANANIHQGQPVLMAGKPPEQAQAAMILLHGRGAAAQDILSLAAELPHPDFAYLAPQAAGYSWYPQRFMMPLESNEPHLSSALATLADLLARIEAAGIPPERMILLGFSQGACLALEFAARHARRYGGVMALTGALIGPDGTPRNYAGSLAGTPVFLGSSDVDFHVPAARIRESAEVMTALGGQVTLRFYPGMGHAINADEIAFVRSVMESAAGKG